MWEIIVYMKQFYNQISNFSYLEQLLSKVFRADSENPEHPERFSRTKFVFWARLLEKENSVIIPTKYSYSIDKHEVSDVVKSTQTSESKVCFFLFKGPRVWHMEVPGLGVELELQLRPTPQPQQHWTEPHLWSMLQSVATPELNPLSEVRDRTHILMDISWVFNLLSHNGNSFLIFIFGHAHGMWNIPGQGLNLCHSSNNAESLTHCATREPRSFFFFNEGI